MLATGVQHTFANFVVYGSVVRNEPHVRPACFDLPQWSLSFVVKVTTLTISSVTAARAAFEDRKA
jgi:hypothetical protein